MAKAVSGGLLAIEKGLKTLPKEVNLSEFFSAIKNNDITTVFEMLSEKPILVHAKLESLAESPKIGSKKEKRFETGLYIAVTENLLEMAALLIKPYVIFPVHNRDSENNTPLFYANTVEMAQLLIENGARLDSKGMDDDRPLHWAAMRGVSEVVEYLIETGAPVDAINNSGQTPLQTAITLNGRNNLAIAKLLVFKGANVNGHSKSGWTALHDAASTGDTQMVSFLISKDAVDKADRRGRTALDIAKAKQASASSEYDASIITILSRAASPEAKLALSEPPRFTS